MLYKYDLYIQALCIKVFDCKRIATYQNLMQIQNYSTELFYFVLNSLRDTKNIVRFENTTVITYTFIAKRTQESMFKTVLKPTYVGIGNRILNPRSYHSISHPTSNNIINSQTIESKIFNKSLEYIPEHGFNSICITNAIRDLQYPDSLTSLLTSSNKGTLGFQLILYYLKFQRSKLINEEILNPDSSFHKIPNEYQRVSYLLNKRLQSNAPYIKKLDSGLAQLIIPYNLSQSLEELHNLSDDISYYSGDVSNDFAWYSKRFGISSIYVTSELYMLNDTSENFAKTNEFVNNKVEEFEKLGDSYNNVEQWTLFNGMSLINLIKSQLLRG